MSLRLSYGPLFLSAALLAEGDILDADLGELLSMALLFRVVFATLHLEDDDLVALSLLDDLGGDVRALESRRTNVRLVAVGAQDDVVKSDLGSGLARESRNSDRFAGFGAVLFSARSYDRVSHRDC